MNPIILYVTSKYKKEKMKILLRLGLIGFYLSALSIKAFAGNEATPPVPAPVAVSSEMALFENIPVVTTAAGRQQKLDDVANAMYVITKEDIERSGARELADLLYRVPGLQVR